MSGGLDPACPPVPSLADGSFGELDVVMDAEGWVPSWAVANTLTDLGWDTEEEDVEAVLPRRLRYETHRSYTYYPAWVTAVLVGALSVECPYDSPEDLDDLDLGGLARLDYSVIAAAHALSGDAAVVAWAQGRVAW